jgi:hypothetical protein
MNIPAYLSSAVQRIGVLESDTSDVRLQKAILVGGSLLIVTACDGVDMIYYRERLAAALSLGYASITLASLLVFTRTRKHRLFS